MNITIDCRMLGSSGIGVYLEGCLPFFLDSPHNFLLLGKGEKISSLLKSKKKNNYSIEECKVAAFSPKEFIAFPKPLLKKINQRDIFYSPYFNIPGGIKVPVFTTIHDIIFPDMPELVSLPGLWARMFFYRRAARLSALIFTVSEFSKSRIARHLGDKAAIINASNAVCAASNGGNAAKKKFVLFIGNIKKHKGLNILLDAFLRCVEEGLDYQLVIVGSKDNFRSKDKESAGRLENLENRGVVFTGFIPEDQKWRLLAESSLLAQPSLYEGFGYPPLEAMLAGTRVLISDIPVFREVYGDFPAVFFKAGDSGDLKTKMMELLYRKEPAPVKLPIELIEKYSFKKTVNIILDQFGQALKKGA